MKYEVSDKHFIPLLSTIRRSFSNSRDTIWDKRNKLKIVAPFDTELLIKSFKIPHIINKIAYTFLRASKARRSYENSLKIIEFVPNPIGYAEFFKFGLLYDSYFVSEKYDYDFTIREPLTQEDFPDKKAVFEAFASFTYALHQKGVEHLDYSPGNILIKRLENSDYEFKVIDVNRMNFKVLSQEDCLENFAKLWANDEDLKIIITEYAKLIVIDTEKALAIVRKASEKHKDKKNRKKKLFKHLKPRKITLEDLEKRKDLLKPISVVIMAKNADETIRNTLDSLTLFDEVILYLNHSTDKTESIAQEYTNVKVIQGEFLGFGPTKNEAASYSKNDWILSLDSDEVLNTALIYEMTQINFENMQTVYTLKRDNYFLGRKTQHSNMIVRMYHKGYTHFDNRMVHEKIIVPKESKEITLKHSFTHLYISNINQTLHKMIHYTDLGAKDKETCFFIVVIAKSIFAFFKTYILEGNISKGWVGYVLAVNSANKRHYKYLKQYINCIDKKKSS